jgi:hypothetical protein
VVRDVKARYPSASYEASVRGYEWRSSAGVKKFGHDLRSALFWARQVVGTARVSPCEVVIDAVTGADRASVYLVARDASGMRREERLVRR